MGTSNPIQIHDCIRKHTLRKFASDSKSFIFFLLFFFSLIFLFFSLFLAPISSIAATWSNILYSSALAPHTELELKLLLFKPSLIYTKSKLLVSSRSIKRHKCLTRKTKVSLSEKILNNYKARIFPNTFQQS